MFPSSNATNLPGVSWMLYPYQISVSQKDTVSHFDEADLPTADMRHTSVISNDSGTILLVARERGLMRLYIPLTSPHDEPSKRIDRSNINLDMLKATAQKIFHPYKFEFEICDCMTLLTLFPSQAC